MREEDCEPLARVRPLLPALAELSQEALRAALAPSRGVAERSDSAGRSVAVPAGIDEPGTHSAGFIPLRPTDSCPAKRRESHRGDCGLGSVARLDRVESFTAAVVEVDVDPGKDQSSPCLGTVDLGAVDLTAPRARGRPPSRSLGEMPRPTRPTPSTADPRSEQTGRRRRHRRPPGTARVEEEHCQRPLLLVVRGGA
jgi:hypothetical protein